MNLRFVLASRRGTAALALSVGALAAGCGSSNGPASYVGRASNAVIYVSWTRSHDTLSGQLTQARESDQPDGSVDTEQTSFTGTVSGSAVSLQLNLGLGSTTTLTGKLSGGRLDLDYPGAGGGIITVPMRKGDAGDYNAALAALRGKATRAKQAADQAAAQQQAEQEATQQVDALRSDISALSQSADDATASAPDTYQSDVDTVSSDLDTVKSDYGVLTEDQANGYDTICDDASNIRGDVGNMRGDIASLHQDVSSSSDPSQLNQDMAQVREQMAQVEAIEPSLLPPDVPTRQQVNAAIRAARAKVRRQGAAGSSFGKAQALLAQAEAIEGKANAACQAGG